MSNSDARIAALEREVKALKAFVDQMYLSNAASSISMPTAKCNGNSYTHHIRMPDGRCSCEPVFGSIRTEEYAYR